MLAAPRAQQVSAGLAEVTNGLFLGRFSALCRPAV